MKQDRESRRAFLHRLARSTALAALPSLGGCGLSAGSRKQSPNILLLLSDDLGFCDLGCFGSEIPTPHIDALAKNGLRFTNFCVTAPVCTPSRYSLLTGRYPFRAPRPLRGALIPGRHDDSRMPTDEVTLAQVLKSRGYSTGLIGKWHLGHPSNPRLGGPRSFGFDSFYGFLPGCVDYYRHSYGLDPNWFRNEEPLQEEGYATDLLTREALRIIQKNQNNPFFLCLSFSAPHYGKCPDGGFLQTPPGFPDLPLQAKSDRRIYSAMVQNMDSNIGLILEQLTKQNLSDHTIIIFLSDNGADPDFGGSNQPLRGEKSTLFEGGIRIPCLMQWPGHFPADQIRSQPLISLDLLPTLAGITGAALPTGPLDGQDIASVLFHNQSLADRRFFFQYASQIAVRDGRWKYVKDNNNTEYLFDISSDPSEQTNLLSIHPEQAKAMNQKFHAFLKTIPSV